MTVFFLDDLSNFNEWDPDIISGVVRPPEQVRLVHGMEAIRSVSSSSSSSGTILLLLLLVCQLCIKQVNLRENVWTFRRDRENGP